MCVSYFQNGPAVASDNSSRMALTSASKYRCSAFVIYRRCGVAVDSYDDATNRMQLTTAKTTGWKCCVSYSPINGLWIPGTKMAELRCTVSYEFESCDVQHLVDMVLMYY
jgi:hypothetical protein